MVFLVFLGIYELLSLGDWGLLYSAEFKSNTERSVILSHRTTISDFFGLVIIFHDPDIIMEQMGVETNVDKVRFDGFLILQYTEIISFRKTTCLNTKK